MNEYGCRSLPYDLFHLAFLESLDEMYSMLSSNFPIELGKFS